MNNSATSPDGFTYRADEFGAIHQVNAQPIEYSPAYISARYLPSVVPFETLNGLAMLRWGYFLGLLRGERPPRHVLDWGYGAGWFLKAAAATPGVTAYGYDISGWPIPPQAQFVPNPMEHLWDLVTFYDVLEHMPNLDFLRNLNTRWLVVSVPWCHAWIPNAGADWAQFWNWKHRRPNEHLHHWDLRSLEFTLRRYGFDVLWSTSVEDIIRRPAPGGRANILTVTARRV